MTLSLEKTEAMRDEAERLLAEFPDIAADLSVLSLRCWKRDLASSLSHGSERARVLEDAARRLDDRHRVCGDVDRVRRQAADLEARRARASARRIERKLAAVRAQIERIERAERGA